MTPYSTAVAPDSFVTGEPLAQDGSDLVTFAILVEVTAESSMVGSGWRRTC
jgi:hypothetical protein